MSEKLSFLDGQPPAGSEGASAPQAAPAPSAGETAAAGVQRDEQGRFASAASTRPPPAAAEAPPPMTRDEQLEAALYDQNLRSSRRFAEREYGKETVAAVHDWAARRCDEDPRFNQEMRNSPDPYEAAYQAYHREQILQTVKPNDLAAFKAWQAAQAGAGQTTTHQGAAPQGASTSVPRSLVTASGTGGAGAPHVPVGPGMAFASAITR